MYISGVILLTFTAMTLETTFLNLVKIRDVKPDLILICALYCAFYLQKPKAVAAGFFMGLIQDALTFGFIGVHAILKCFVVLVISSSREKYLNENALVEYVLSVITIFFSAIVLAIALPTASGFEFTVETWKDVFVMTVYTIIFLPPVFIVISFYKERLKKVLQGRVRH